jgi:hypothetical protein
MTKPKILNSLASIEVPVINLWENCNMNSNAGRISFDTDLMYDKLENLYSSYGIIEQEDWYEKDKW